jgi:hypothetical protein
MFFSSLGFFSLAVALARIDPRALEGPVQPANLLDCCFYVPVMPPCNVIQLPSQHQLIALIQRYRFLNLSFATGSDQQWLTSFWGRPSLF